MGDRCLVNCTDMGWPQQEAFLPGSIFSDNAVAIFSIAQEDLK